MLGVELVDDVEVELDFFPGIHGDRQFGAVLGRFGQNITRLCKFSRKSFSNISLTVETNYSNDRRE